MLVFLQDSGLAVLRSSDKSRTGQGYRLTDQTIQRCQGKMVGVGTFSPEPIPAFQFHFSVKSVFSQEELAPFEKETSDDPE